MRALVKAEAKEGLVLRDEPIPKIGPDDILIKVAKTGNADLPMKHGQTALLTMDVWEHAYYIDYRNARPKYIEAFCASLVNWDFAAQNLAQALQLRLTV